MYKCLWVLMWIWISPQYVTDKFINLKKIQFVQLSHSRLSSAWKTSNMPVKSADFEEQFVGNKFSFARPCTSLNPEGHKFGPRVAALIQDKSHHRRNFINSVFYTAIPRVNLCPIHHITIQAEMHLISCGEWERTLL